MENNLNDNSHEKRVEINAERELNKLKRRSAMDHAKVLELDSKYDNGHIAKINKLYEEIEVELKKAIAYKENAVFEEKRKILSEATDNFLFGEEPKDEKDKLNYVKNYLLLIGNTKGYVTLNDITFVSYSDVMTDQLIDYLKGENVRIRGLNK